MGAQERSIVPFTPLLVFIPGLLTLIIGVVFGFVPLEAFALILLVMIVTFLSSLYLRKYFERLLSLNHVSVKTFHIIYGLFVLLLGVLYGHHTILTLVLACLISYGLYEYIRWSRRVDIPLIAEILKLLGSPEGVEGRPFLSPAYASLGIFITSAFFTPQIAFAAISVLVLGDGFATLFGRAVGRIPLPVNGRKTVEGSLTGFIMGFLGCLPFVSIEMALIGSFAGMLMEALPIPLNDNLTIPVFSAFCMTLAYNLTGF